ncbi:MAG: hypothetical protein ACJAZ2_000113 [Glaciecola sp.]|jgi:uncharacterized protein (TIRG00374 family)
MIYSAWGMNFDEILAKARTMNFSFFIISAIMALFAHLSRAIRWRYLIRSFGYNPKLKNVFLSVLFMYFSNLIIPRSGEVARCGTLYKYEKIPVKNLLGTVVVERLIDLLTLLLGTALLMFFQFSTVKGMYYKVLEKRKLVGNEEPGVLDYIMELVTSKGFLIILGVVFLATIYVAFHFRKKIVNTKLFQKLVSFKGELIEGAKKVLKLKQKAAFFGHTVFIWGMYFGMTYICFFAYEPTASLGLSAGFAVFMAGSYGMVVPTNGGIGAWHLMVGLALSIFGVSDGNGVAIAQVAFATMTAAVILYGATAVVILPFINKNKSK